jgi:hypothetical protein
MDPELSSVEPFGGVAVVAPQVGVGVSGELAPIIKSVALPECLDGP